MNQSRCIFLIIFLFSIAFTSAIAAKSAMTPAGYWKTIDDVTGKPQSVLHIFEKKDHTIAGRIVQTFRNENDPQPPLKICSKCTGARHNKPILGLVILEKLKQDPRNPNEWQGGEILDPQTGKTYHCTMKVLQGGQKLNVRGYIGLPLFGRTQTWVRVNKPNDTQSS